MGEQTERLHVLVRGRVQGVGYRYATCAMARQVGLAGWVRNLPDGGVEAEFEGTREQLERALAWCEAGPPAAHVTALETAWSMGDGAYDGFSIRR